MNAYRRFFGTLVSVTGLSALIASGGAWTNEFSEGWGPAIGTKLPLLTAPDQNGVTRTLADLAGEQGLLLFLNRSADW